MKKTMWADQSSFSLHNVQDTAYALNAIERTCSYDDFERSARFCEAALKAAGFSRVERISHPADGVATAFDCVMPQAWDLDKTRRSYLEIVDGSLSPEERLLADTAANPLHALVWSAPTPKGGLTAEVVDLDTLEKGRYEAARGKWVLYAKTTAYSSTSPSTLMWGLYRELTEAGVAGLVVCDMNVVEIMPDALCWENGIGYTGWYLTKGEKKLPAFAITPLTVRRLRRLLAMGPVTLHGELNCRNYDGAVHTVTAVVPGESKEEVALLAHLYEPFVNDDAAGFANLCEFGRQLVARKVKLKRTLRVVFSMELYGMAAYLEKDSRNIVLAANFDGIPFKDDADTVIVRRTPIGLAHFCDWLAADIMHARLPKARLVSEYASYSDDTFTNDPDFGRGGIPTFWWHSGCSRSHHSTGYLFEPDWTAAGEQLPVFAEILETLLCAESLPDYSRRAAKELNAAAAGIFANAKLGTYEKWMALQAEHLRQESRLASVKAFTGQAVDTALLAAAWKRIAARLAKLPPPSFKPAERRALQIVPKRGRLGYPFSLAAVPLAQRRPVKLPHAVWALFDGKRNLLECIRMADADRGGATTAQKAIAALIEELAFLEKFGYVTLKEQ